MILDLLQVAENKIKHANTQEMEELTRESLVTYQSCRTHYMNPYDTISSSRARMVRLTSAESLDDE